VAVLAGLSATSARAATADWAGGTGNWSTENVGSAGTAGWIGLLPDAIGDVGIYNTTGKSSATTNQDLTGNRTVGRLEVTGNANASWQVTLAAGKNLILNQDGAGPATAVLSNTMTSPAGSSNPTLILNSSAGIITLNDDLLITNTGTSTRTTGSIQIDPQIQGAGNITFYNVSNNTGAGQIALFRTSAGASNFSGQINIAKGAVVFNRGDRFTPSPGNVITIGKAGEGDATLAFAGASLGNMENGFVAAAGTGGTSVFGTTSAVTALVNIKTTNTNAAAFTLNGDLTFSSGGTGMLNVGDRILGIGKVTKAGTGPMRVSNANTYSGGTLVTAGTLAVGHDDAIGSQFGFHDATNGTLGTGNVSVSAAAMSLELEAGVAGVNVIGDTATVSLAGGGAAGVADSGYMILNAGVNETVGALMLNGVFQPIGTYGSTASVATFRNDEYFSGPGILNVTLAPEPASLSLLAVAASGLLMRRRRSRRV
jgi:autotransporter-associated beta strand protein